MSNHGFVNNPAFTEPHTFGLTQIPVAICISIASQAPKAVTWLSTRYHQKFSQKHSDMNEWAMQKVAELLNQVMRFHHSNKKLASREKLKSIISQPFMWQCQGLSPTQWVWMSFCAGSYSTTPCGLTSEKYLMLAHISLPIIQEVFVNQKPCDTQPCRLRSNPREEGNGCCDNPRAS